ncbi:MAG: DUF234 domain-containing protein [Patescibacteria group bacterium]
MKIKFTKIIFLFIVISFISTHNAHAQSCNSLKEIFENLDYCDNKQISIGGAISEILDYTTLSGSKYLFGFWMIDENKNRIRVVSADEMVLIDGNVVIVDGRYYKKLYADGLNLDDTIVASSDNIQVVLTARELWNDILGPYGESLNTGKKLAIWNKSFIAITPLFSAIAFYFGLMFYKRRQYKGISFEGYVENLFNKQEWRIAESNAYRKLGRWVESYSNPDFVFIHRKTNKRIAVECKYKSVSRKENDRLFWAYEDQIENYQNFSTKKGVPVFVVIGIGGRPKNPKKIFLAPLSLVKYPDVKMNYLQKFERDPRKPFLFNGDGNLI